MPARGGRGGMFLREKGEAGEKGKAQGSEKTSPPPPHPPPPAYFSQAEWPKDLLTFYILSSVLDFYSLKIVISLLS
jgi:hypothetical protein